MKGRVKGNSKNKAHVYAYKTPSERVQVGKSETKSAGTIIKWGEKDDLPAHYLRLIDGSGTATRCLQQLGAFIYADGFADEEARKYKVNETQTADALLYELKNEVSYLETIPLRIRYALDHTKTAEVLPTECIRKLSDGTFIYNPTFGQKKFDKNQEEILQPYDPSEETVNAILAEATATGEQPGQIYYLYPKRKGAYDYAKPPYTTTAGLADIETDKELSQFDLEEVKNSFMPNAILTLLGRNEAQPDGEVSEDDRALQEQLREFTGKTKDCNGRKKLLVLEAETAELAPKLQSFDGTSALNGMDSINERVVRKVCRHIGVPPALVGVAAPGQLGQTQEIVNAIDLMKLSVMEYQGLIQRVMEELFPEAETGVSNWTITSLNPLNYVQPEVLAKMTTDEIRAIGGLAPVELPQNNEAELAINALNSLPPSVVNKVLDAMTEDEIRALIGKAPKPQPSNPATL